MEGELLLTTKRLRMTEIRWNGLEITFRNDGYVIDEQWFNINVICEIRGIVHTIRLVEHINQKKHHDEDTGLVKNVTNYYRGVKQRNKTEQELVATILPDNNEQAREALIQLINLLIAKKG